VTPHRIRRCIVCGSRDEYSRLLRFVVNKDGEVELDKERIASGRGAHCHMRLQCVTKLSDAKLWRRAFRGSAAHFPDEVFDKVVKECSE